MPGLETSLKDASMLSCFRDVEVPSSLILSAGDLNGFGFSEYEAGRQRRLLQTRLDQLEKEAFKLAGREFRISSSQDVSQILYRELRLPLDGDEEKGSVRGKGRHSVNKEVLLRMKKFHPLPSIIIEWRKINASISNVIGPFEGTSVEVKAMKMNRIFPTSNTFTATGRVTLQDPSLQMVPRDFGVKVDSNLLKLTSRRRDVDRSSLLLKSFESLIIEDEEGEDQLSCSVSLRRAFVPSEGCLLVAADFCQLELRMLAHLSKDKNLIEILKNDEVDVFKSVARNWLGIHDITDEQRQQAKQICYGIVYGIGAKSLGEQLEVGEDEALEFMTSFKNSYPGIQKFIDKVIEDCKTKGYVTTLYNRRRYLPNIKLMGDENQFARAAAERQAVNSTVQGSAADLVKRALIKIQGLLEKSFEQRNVSKPLTSGAMLVLQLHDELIYEVASQDLVQVAQIIRIGMESCVELLVPTPVKVKVGSSWGTLQTLKEI